MYLFNSTSSHISGWLTHNGFRGKQYKNVRPSYCAVPKVRRAPVPRAQLPPFLLCHRKSRLTAYDKRGFYVKRKNMELVVGYFKCSLTFMSGFIMSYS